MGFLDVVIGFVVFTISLIVYDRMKRRAALRAAEATRRAAQEAAAAEAARRATEHAAFEQQRWNQLCGRFGPDLAARIYRGELWVGMTAGMLMHSKGPPEDIDEKVLKTKTKHVYKYVQTGINRYALRVTLDDGVVTGWDDKT
ncbi:hypothetical protein WMF28_09895 [Sorangium sp. So ce590]|uniref:hypothetical protein n=1 Tax=Sorangium sp. So ce590 TaxID=3133317 RepID=UPI003F5DEACA